jgi:hypothetical protein
MSYKYKNSICSVQLKFSQKEIQEKTVVTHEAIQKYRQLMLFTEPLKWSQDSTVGIAIGYWLDNRGVGVRGLIGSRIFSSPCHSDRLFGPPSFPSNGYQGLFSRW